MAKTKARKKIRLGDLLVAKGLITEEQMRSALETQKTTGHKLGRTLIDLGYVEEEQMLETLSRQLDIPVIDLRHYQFDAEIAGRLPEKYARRYRSMLLSRSDEEAEVAMEDPTDIFACDELSRLLNCPVKPLLVREEDLLRTLDLVYRQAEKISNLAEELGQELAQSDYDIAQLAAEAEAADTPVIRLLQTMFEDAVQVNASDIHIEPDEKVVRIRQRIDGVLHEQVLEGRRVAEAMVTRLKLMANLDIAEKRLPQDGRFSISISQRSIDVRLSTMPIQHGESVVMRLLDQTANLRSVAELGMPEQIIAPFERMLRHPSGVLLITGPTGSGKTTTLYAALKDISTSELKIITVEDPVEYRLPRVNQVQVNERIGLSFSRVLRTALRQDPDVILVGEMRDQETVEIGLRAALTGHLVLSSLHTNDAISTISRLLDMGAQGYMLASTLQGVVAQRLVRRICEGCCTDYEMTPQDHSWLRSHIGVEQADAMDCRHGTGCTLCNNTGYRGRIGVYELLEMNTEMSDLLRKEDDFSFARIARAQAGFHSLARSGIEFVRQGITTISEVIRISGMRVEDEQEMEDMNSIVAAADGIDMESA